MKDKYIIVIVGKSGSGKSTICDALTEKYGLKQVKSYATRPRRGDNDNSHIFVTFEEFDALHDKCAYTFFDGNHYCATSKQVDESDLYIIDPKGIDYFLKHYDGKKIPMIIYISTSKDIRFNRMVERGDTKYRANKRLSYDNKAFDVELINDYAIKVYENNTREDLDWIVDYIYKVFFREQVGDDVEITDEMYKELKSLCNQLSKFIRENFLSTTMIHVNGESFGIADVQLIDYTDE